MNVLNLYNISYVGGHSVLGRWCWSAWCI